MSPYKLIWIHGDSTETVLCFTFLSWALMCKFAVDHDNANKTKLVDCNGTVMNY